MLCWQPQTAQMRSLGSDVGERNPRALKVCIDIQIRDCTHSLFHKASMPWSICIFRAEWLMHGCVWHVSDLLMKERDWAPAASTSGQ